MRIKNKKLDNFLSSKWSTILIVGVFVTILVLYARNQFSKIQRSPIVTKGKVYEIFTAGRGMNGYSIKYTWNYDGKEFESETMLACRRSRLLQTHLECFLIGKELPVVYEKKHPDNAFMLLKAERYKDFDLNVPDSIKEIISYLDQVASATSPFEDVNPCK